MNQERPPLQCRVISYGGSYNTGEDVMPSHVLEWRGETLIRANKEKDDQWKLHASPEKWTWAERWEIEILGRTPGSHTFREKLADGSLKQLFEDHQNNDDETKP